MATVAELRTRLNLSSSYNQSLQDILKSCSAGTKVISVSAIEAKVHNTKLVLMIDYGSNYPADQRYKERVCFYNRLNLAVILDGVAVTSQTLEDLIHELNLKGYDFTTDDLELTGNKVTALPKSLGYYGEAVLAGINTDTSNPISSPISCAGAALTFICHTGLENLIKVSMNDGPWIDLSAANDTLNITYHPVDVGATLIIGQFDENSETKVRLKSDKPLFLYVNPTTGLNDIEQQNQSYFLYDLNGEQIDPTLSKNLDYSGQYLDDTSTNQDYVVAFNQVSFCLSKRNVTNSSGWGIDFGLNYGGTNV